MTVLYLCLLGEDKGLGKRKILHDSQASYTYISQILHVLEHLTFKNIVEGDFCREEPCILVIKDLCLFRKQKLQETRMVHYFQEPLGCNRSLPPSENKIGKTRVEFHLWDGE
jgi:hypothetical protein